MYQYANIGYFSALQKLIQNAKKQYEFSRKKF